MSFNPCVSLGKGVGSLLTSEKYSDLTITTQTRSFKVHKAIVCTQSKVLAAMSDSGFKETSTAILSLENDDPAAVERMISFLYTGKYDQGNPPAAVEDASPFVGPILMTNTLVYSLADKYDVQRLKVLAKLKFEKLAFAAWKCEEFPAIAATVFDSTPDSDRGLRDVVAGICSDHVDQVLTSDIWREVLETDGTIGIAILNFARRNSVAEIDQAKKLIERCERELDLAKACNERLCDKFRQANANLENVIAKWSFRTGHVSCDRCGDSFYEGLMYDLEAFTRGFA